MAALLPLAVTVALGGVDGALRAADVKAGRSSVISQRSTWMEVGAVVVGAFGATRRWNADIVDPLVIGGLFGLGQRGGAQVLHAVAPSLGGGRSGSGSRAGSHWIGGGDGNGGGPSDMLALAPGSPMGPRHERYAPHGVFA